jgi:hypothetical protein
MEHRWGRRTFLWTPVQLRSDAGAARGRVRDASASGGFIETELVVAVGGRVEIEFRGAWIAACVVRTEAAGFALEWFEFAPPAIVETLDRLDELRRLHADFGRSLPRDVADLRKS